MPRGFSMTTMALVAMSCTAALLGSALLVTNQHQAELEKRLDEILAMRASQPVAPPGNDGRRPRGYGGDHSEREETRHMGMGRHQRGGGNPQLEASQEAVRDPYNVAGIADAKANVGFTAGGGAADPLDGWIPIDVDGSYKQVTLCRLAFDKHAENPATLPMFKDLVKASPCEDRKRMSMEELENLQGAREPTGFVFHESRVGSTLVADMLASDPDNMVFSESSPPPKVSLHCNGCTKEKQIHLLRTIMRGMCNSKRHKRCFFKLQSSNSAFIDVFLQAFPNVPWMYLYRDPVEVLASQFKHGDQPPCNRGHDSRSVARLFPNGPSSVTNMKYCAARMGEFGDKALEALDNYGNGIVINYKQLPNVLPDLLLETHFNYGHLANSARGLMMKTSTVYSKSRSKSPHDFTGDTAEKQKKASEEMKTNARDYMQTSFVKLEQRNKEEMEKMHAKAARGSPPNRGGRSEEPAAMPSMEDSDSLGFQMNNGETLAKSPFSSQGGFQGHFPNKPGKAGARWEEDVYVPTGFEGTPVPKSEREVANSNNYIPFPEMANLVDLLTEWPPDDPNVPNVPGINAGTLKRFDYRIPEQKAEAKRYQMHEVPFMLTNVPEIADVVEKWSSDKYLTKSFGKTPQHVLQSSSNHFMYWSKQQARQQRDTYTPPTKPMVMSFPEFLQARDKAEKSPVDSSHVYLQLNNDPSHDFITKDMAVFKPEKSFFIVDPKKNRGINCRFGARGIIAETHYDGGRNFIAMLRGAKRYVLAPPSECKKLYLYPRGHPEGRHAKGDWSQLDLDTYPDMAKAKATQVIVREGEILYIPSYWFHYIVSMGGSIQCNTRSGTAQRGRDDIKDCGFY